MTDSSRSAWLRRLRSGRPVFLAILLTGVIVSLVLTAPSATSYVNFVESTSNTSIIVTYVTWEADSTNSSVTISVSYLIVNPSDSPIDLTGFEFNIALNGRSILGGISVGVSRVSVYNGHNVTALVVRTATIQSTVNFILGQNSFLWYLDGSAIFRTGVRTVYISFAQSYLG